jgi:hypothetical protein
LEALPPATVNGFRLELSAVQDAMRAGVVPARSRKAKSHWDKWTAFCHSLGQPPLLPNVSANDKVVLLQVYALRYRDRLSPSGGPVRAATVGDALCAVGQTFALLGAPDPRKDSLGNIDYRLRLVLRSFSRKDPAPHRVKPVPISILQNILNAAYSSSGTHVQQAVADMACIAFFFLLRPGEYTGTEEGLSAPFRLKDVSLCLGRHCWDISTTSAADLHRSTGSSLTFDNQKNGVRGEIIAHGLSGAFLCCATHALTRRVLYLREHGALPTTPLASYYANNNLIPITSTDITGVLRQAVRDSGPGLGLLPSDIEARSLRASGAMALKCANVDDTDIMLRGRWLSDSMLRYLHSQCLPAVGDLARQMLHGGAFVVGPTDVVPQQC